MTGIEISIASVFLIVILIYSGLYITVALGLVSFIGVWIMRGNIEMPISLLSIAVILGWLGLFFVFLRVLTISIKKIPVSYTHLTLPTNREV